jgi:hypothetical protein
MALTAHESDRPNGERPAPRSAASLDEILRRLLGRRPESGKN